VSGGPVEQLLVVLVPIVGIVAFLWFADREIISSVCPNCGNPFQVLEEAVWLRTMHKIITEQCGLAQDNKPTVIFEDNAACVAQVGAGFIKTDRVKHISPHLFGYTQDLVETKQIEVKKIESAHNIADIMTKALPAYTHRRLVQEAGMRLLHEIV